MNTSLTRSTDVNRYIQNKLTLFPCGSGKGGKAPKAGEMWRQTAFNPRLSAEALPDMFGVAIPEWLVIIDVDVKDGKQGIPQVQQLWKNLNLPPLATFTVRTASGGFHLYFRKPEGITLRAHIPGLNALDIQRHGQYVIGAGSPGYTVYKDLPIADCPPALLELLSQAEDFSQESGVVDDSPSTQSRFIEYCLRADPAIKGLKGNINAYKTACVGLDFGLSASVAEAILLEHYLPRCKPNDKPEFISRIVANAYHYAQNEVGKDNALKDFAPENLSDDLLAECTAEAAKGYKVVFKKDKKGKLENSISNVYSFFFVPESPLYELVRYDSFGESIEFTRQPFWRAPDDTNPVMNDIDEVMIRLWLSRNQGIDVSVNTVHEAALAASKYFQFHPIRQWIKSIEWDGIERLERLFIRYAGAEDNVYTRDVGHVVGVGAVARVFEPGCKMDYMAVMESEEQGIGKGEFVGILGGKWSAVVHIQTDAGGRRDTVQAMQGAWILEAAEMEFTRYDNVMAMKAFMTIKVDRCRLPYQRFATFIPRQSIFIGTVNPDATGEYLKDKTGNRRFLPIKCGWLDLEALKRDRDQIFAEAYQRYLRGDKPMLSAEGEAIANQEQKARTVHDEWQEIIKHWLEEIELPDDFCTTEQVASGALNMPTGRLDRATACRISDAMRSAGFERHKAWIQEDKKTKWGWLKKDPLLG